jgi:DNA-binding response OmpR family regulator
MAKHSLLSVGFQPDVLHIRNAALGQAGFLVRAAATRTEAIELFDAIPFDLVILCHSIPLIEKRLLSAFMKAEDPIVPIVQVRENDDEGKSVAGWVQAWIARKCS